MQITSESISLKVDYSSNISVYNKKYKAMTVDYKEINKRITELQAKLNITFPSLYIEFLAKINDGDLYEVENSGICLYSYSDLEERNKTYQIKDFEPNYFMIGQNGDLGYFINVDDPNDNSIYSNDLGALGSLEMEKESSNIFDFIGRNEK